MEFEGEYKIPYFSIIISNPTVVKNGHSGANFVDGEFSGFYSDVELKNDSLFNSVIYRLEDEIGPIFIDGATYTEALNTWIVLQMEKIKI